MVKSDDGSLTLSTLIPVVIGRKPFDADPLVVRMLLWLLCHQHEVTEDDGKMTVTWGKHGIKVEVSHWHTVNAEGDAA